MALLSSTPFARSAQLWRGPAVASEATADGRWMHLVWITLIGLAAGLAGRLVTAGKKGPFGFMLTILLGIIGAFVGP